MLYPKAVRVIPLPEYRMEIHFDNGECRLFDVKPYLHGEWFLQLLDVNVFNQVKIDGLSVSWPDGQDIAPDCLYVNAYKNETVGFASYTWRWRSAKRYRKFLPRGRKGNNGKDGRI